MPKTPKFKNNDAEWTEDLALYLKDFNLAKYVYDAIQITQNFRLSFEGTVLYSRPSGVTTACPGGTKLWTSRDMEWDDQGCLVILDKTLGKLIKEAHDNAYPFKIEVPVKAVASNTDPGGGIGENTVNAMCFC